MAKSVIIKLTTAGTSVGPFNMLSDADSYATPFEFNISRATLVTGYTSSLVPNAATIIRALSSGSCTNYVDLTINVPTTTTTTTTTTTAAPTTTSTTTTTTTAAPTTTTSTTTTTTTAAPTTTSTTTTTTTAAPTTTSTTTTTTTAAPTTTTSTTTTTTTNIPYTQSFYTGSSLLTACAETNPVDLYYNGALGVGTILYQGPGYSNPVVPTKYCKVDNNNVYVVGTPSPEDGYITEIVTCPTTTTTTTTTAPPFDYYYADEIDCNGCTSITADVLVKFAGGSSVTLNKYYRTAVGSGVYLLNEAASSGTAVTLNSLMYNDCASACPATTTTTTTTTTAAPTTSTTTTTTTAAPTTTSTTTTTTTAAPTTTTSTTTTTTTDPYDYYIADEIDCSNCSVIAADQRVAFPIGTSVTLNRYYRYVGFENDFTYFVKEVTTTGGAVALELPAYTNCNAACGNTTTTSTTTTTTTAASTTTSTTTTTTTTIGYDFYYADDYSCADPCGLYAAAQIVAFPAGSSVTNNKFYSWSGGTDSFKITGTTIDPSYPVPLLYPADGPFNSCTLACPV